MPVLANMLYKRISRDVEALHLFGVEFAHNIRSVASLMPSSGFLATAMVKRVKFAKLRSIMELGAGTGAITQVILRRMNPDAQLVAVESNLNFAQFIRTHYDNARLLLLACNAADVLAKATESVGNVDLIISSIGLTLMTMEERTQMIQQIKDFLTHEGIFVQMQYIVSHLIFDEVRFLRQHFRAVSVDAVFLNASPALVFTCQEKVDSANHWV